MMENQNSGLRERDKRIAELEKELAEEHEVNHILNQQAEDLGEERNARRVLMRENIQLEASLLSTCKELSESAKDQEKAEAELEISRKAYRYELNEVKCADEAIVELEAERDKLRDALDGVVEIRTGVIMRDTIPQVIISQPAWDELKNQVKKALGHD